MGGTNDSSRGRGCGLAPGAEHPAVPCVAAGRGLRKPVVECEHHCELFPRLCDRDSPPERLRREEGGAGSWQGTRS